MDTRRIQKKNAVFIELQLETGHWIQDQFKLDDVYTECHRKHAWKIFGGGPVVGQSVEVLLDEDSKRPVFKGYRKA